ncbi:ASCH domain-containing protein [Paraclostridium bifermentans]|uniref:ASCH domain-containing protein n=1 Tax=Paraclostridium bifermentans TaxID=1490 RepID=UPI00291479C8|nr:ASCH domain-containing protein [Paraclostridium bifermentans]MDU3338008.1 ASCH domain-containing protein [Paraclostridium bifermentans]
MKNEEKSVKDMWENYLNSIGECSKSSNKVYDSWHFCDNEKSANKLAGLVLDGVKKGTTSLYDLYKVDNEPIPKKDEYNVVTDWNGIAKCVIRTKEIFVLPFKDVDERLASIEGDKSLRYWREAHIDFFKRELEALNMEFTEDMLVVFEEFEVVYK